MIINADFSSETGLKNRLDQLYKHSKEGKHFNGLFEIAFHEITIVTAIHKIKSNKGANTSGVDNARIRKYLEMDKAEVIELVKNSAESYQPKPVRRIYIDKDNGKKRPLGIPTVLDRIIQECIRTVLEPIVEAKFYNHSYGFRPFRATKHALRQINHFVTNGKAYYAIEGDIEGYFDNINHRILLKKLWKIGIKDKRILKIINLMLKAGYMESDFYNRSDTGTPQGGIISPLFANVYLNDFDWLIARRYYQPHLTGNTKEVRKQREKLRYQGRHPCYLVRYADDWVILTTKRQEANRLLVYLRKYFKHKLKLNLSEEKTVITDLKESPMTFLGFDIKVGRPRTKPNSEPVAKMFPNPAKVRKQITEVCRQIKVLRTEPKDEYKVLQIAKINSIIEGIAEYWKTGICKATFAKFDYIINNSLFHTFKRLYPEEYPKYKKKVGELHNRTERHSGYSYSTFAIQYEGFWYGVTIMSITKSQWLKTPFNQKITPYTKEGRELYQREAKKRLPMDRPTLYNLDYMEYIIRNPDSKTKYNFEYLMNREYAYNRDKGKCKVCGKDWDSSLECHHINPNLPLSEINKVSNLAWLCRNCHLLVHGMEIPNEANKKLVGKIETFRKKLKG